MKRCLNCETVLDQVHLCSHCGDGIHFECDCDNLRAELERLRAERRWIPVEERLPEKDVPVLCIDSRGIQMVAWSGWGEWCGPEIETELTHWMPLPPLPDQFGKITQKENQ